MKKLFFTLGIALILTSCSGHRDLYEQTDFFVDQLTYVYQSYGLSGFSEKRFTKDGKYGVSPSGRLINVRIEEYDATRQDYEKLRKNLERHYKNNSHVNDVYICNGGTIMIDCRN